MKKAFDIAPDEFSNWSSHSIVKRILRCNDPVLLLGPIYLLWREEWKLSCKVYAPSMVMLTLGFGLMGYGLSGKSVVIGWAGTIAVVLCLIAAIICNFWLHVCWNDVPHPQKRHLLPAVIGAVLIIFLPPLAMQLGALIAQS